MKQKLFQDGKRLKLFEVKALKTQRDSVSIIVNGRFNIVQKHQMMFWKAQDIYFKFFLLKPEQETGQGDIVINEENKKTIEGETHIYKSGTFYFKSNSANGDWEIRA